MDSSSVENVEPAVLISVAELQRRLDDSLRQLSPARLQVAADFVAYLANAESEAATQELLKIPGLLERINQSQTMPKDNYTNWRMLHSEA